MVRSIALSIALSLAGACGGDDDAGDHGHGDAPSDDAAPGGSDAAPGDDDAGPGPDCAAYCTLIESACVDELQQYFDRESCLATCALFPVGEPDDQLGNTLSCRVHHAELAVADPDPHCYHAGPSGGGGDGVCGSPCESYCTLMAAVCDEVYADDAECMTTCADFPDTRPYSISENRSDTVACRIFHATRQTSQDGHCGTASADSPICTE